VAFVGSRLDERVPVANRYFGVFQDGSLKMRGIETRRRDTPDFVSQTQMQILELMIGVPDGKTLSTCLPQVRILLRRKLSALRSGRVPLEALLVKQKLSRGLDEYRSPSPAARAVAQLQAVGKTLRPGQSVRFIYTLGKPGVYAWNLPQPLNPASVDVSRYTTLLLRAASTVLSPLGVGEAELRDWVAGRIQYVAPVMVNKLGINLLRG
jgi:DNA polymerase-2